MRFPYLPFLVALEQADWRSGFNRRFRRSNRVKRSRTYTPNGKKEMERRRRQDARIAARKAEEEGGEP